MAAAALHADQCDMHVVLGSLGLKGVGVVLKRRARSSSPGQLSTCQGSLVGCASHSWRSYGLLAASVGASAANCVSELMFGDWSVGGCVSAASAVIVYMPNPAVSSILASSRLYSSVLFPLRKLGCDVLAPSSQYDARPQSKAGEQNLHSNPKIERHAQRKPTALLFLSLDQE